MPDAIAVSRRAAALALLALPASRLMQRADAATPAVASMGVTGDRQRIEVGQNREVKTLGAAAILARDGAVIEVDAGEYRGDTAVWTQSDITLRAVGGRVRVPADGRSAESKAIWVVRAERMAVEGFDFSGARVPDGNGAGVRLERGSLRVRDCSFTSNENGILTGNLAETVLEIEDSEFGHNGAGDGHTHNLYAGSIARLSVSGSYFHHARRGHLLKSRAALNFVTYNSLTDGSDGNASYELDFPNGGVSFVIGNIIQQSAGSENPHLVSVGEENYGAPPNELYLVNNTLVDNVAGGGVFLRVSPGADAVHVVNNLLVGKGTWDIGVAAIFRNNSVASATDFAGLAAGDYRLSAISRLRGRATDPGSVRGLALRPAREYRHPAHSAPLPTPPVHPGAIQSVVPKR